LWCAKGNTTADDITAWRKEQTTAYKVPSIVEFMSELPKSPTGKLTWRTFQEDEWKNAD